MPAAIEDDSKRFLDEVRKGKSRKFVLICKGAKVLSLSVFKKGSSDAVEQKAKSAGFKVEGVGTVRVRQGMTGRVEILQDS